jgi:hypothetical protein
MMGSEGGETAYRTSLLQDGWQARGDVVGQSVRPTRHIRSGRPRGSSGSLTMPLRFSPATSHSMAGRGLQPRGRLLVAANRERK